MKRIRTEKKRILLAEDNPSERRLLRGVLGPYGDELVSFENGLDLYFSILTEGADFVFVGVELAGLDGLTLCHLVKAQPKLSSVRVFLLSAWVDEELQSQAEAAGAEALFQKPVEPQELKRLVRGSLEETVWQRPA